MKAMVKETSADIGLAKSNGSVEAFLLLDTYISSFEKINKKRGNLKNYSYSARNFKEYFLIDGYRFLRYAMNFLWGYKITSILVLALLWNIIKVIIDFFSSEIGISSLSAEVISLFLFFFPIFLFGLLESAIRKNKLSFSSIVIYNQYNKVRKKEFLKKFKISSSVNRYRDKEQQNRILDLFYWGKMAFNAESLNLCSNKIDFEQIFNSFTTLNINDVDYAIEVEHLLNVFIENLNNILSEKNVIELSPQLKGLIAGIRNPSHSGDVDTIENRITSILAGNEERLMAAVSERVRR